MLRLKSWLSCLVMMSLPIHSVAQGMDSRQMSDSDAEGFNRLFTQSMFGSDVDVFLLHFRSGECLVLELSLQKSATGVKYKASESFGELEIDNSTETASAFRVTMFETIDGIPGHGVYKPTAVLFLGDAPLFTTLELEQICLPIFKDQPPDCSPADPDAPVIHGILAFEYNDWPVSTQDLLLESDFNRGGARSCE